MTMNTRKRTIYLSALVVMIIALYSCAAYQFRYNYTNTNSLLHDTKNIKTKRFLKAHLKNGDVCILNQTWDIDTINNVVVGKGTKYDFNRTKIYEGDLSIKIDSVAIFETNKKLSNTERGRIATLSVLAGVNVILGVYCVTVPKACYGSCPTFYINENDNFHYADAEGFSNAISPSLEYYDIDALNNKELGDSVFSITMKNEALETHCVNDVKLLAYPRKKGERVYQTSSNEFYLCENSYYVTQAIANEGDITRLLKNNDKEERFSFADENDLKSKEEIVLNFEKVKDTGDLGLVISFRQTMMTTYFIYNAIGYMGDEVGDIFAKLESNNEIKNKLNNGIKKELGNIEVYLWDETERNWKFQNGLYETGPIAINEQIIPLKKSSFNHTVKIKLILNKGLWRIDYAALASIKKTVTPFEIPPSCVLNKGKIDSDALYEINNPKKYLISMPGSEYKFNFSLPNAKTDYELFLYSKGYYLEWMRDYWLKDKNLLKLRQMVENPRKYLKEEAENYKKYETTIEKDFWDSRIDTKTFSYYEN